MVLRLKMPTARDTELGVGEESEGLLQQTDRPECRSRSTTRRGKPRVGQIGIQEYRNGVLGRRDTLHADKAVGLELRKVESTSMTKGLIWTEGLDG